MDFDRTKILNDYVKKLFELQQKLKDYEKQENKEELRKTYASNILDEEDLEGEVWKEYPQSPKYLVSNKGRIKFDGKIQEQINEIDPKTGKINYGYLVLKNNKLRRDYIYNFVAFTFLGKEHGDGYQVHHITNDGNDNSVENLVLLTEIEHSIVHGFKIGNWQ